MSLLGSQGIVVKCTAAIFFRTADYKMILYAQTAFKFGIAHVKVTTGSCRESLGTVRILIHIKAITDHVVKVDRLKKNKRENGLNVLKLIFTILIYKFLALAKKAAGLQIYRLHK